MAMPNPLPMNWYAEGRGSYLGIGVEEIGSERAKQLKLSEPHGVEVTTVAPDSPAAKAGLKEGDVVVEFNGQRVEGTEQFVRLVRETPPRREVKLEVIRDGASRTIAATVGERKAVYVDPKYVQKLRKMTEDLRQTYGTDWNLQQEMQNQFGQDSKFQQEMQKLRDEMEKMHWEMHMPGMPEGPGRGPRLGVEVEPVGPQLAEFFGVKQGVLVKSVNEGSAAEKAGIKAGDVIVKIGDGDVNGAGAISRLMREAGPGKPVSVTVVRNKRSITLNVTPAARPEAGS
jgi:serine protease Do